MEKTIYYYLLQARQTQNVHKNQIMNKNLKASSKQNAKSPKNQKGRISDDDQRFAFLTKTPLPQSEQHYNSTMDVVKMLMDATKYDASIAFALDAFSEYRIKVLTWIYGIKEASIKMTSESKKVPEFALSTVIFKQFNTIQEKLDTIHEKTMKKFEISAKKLIKRVKLSAKERNQIVQKILSQLQKQLTEYEATVEKTQNMLRSTLSFL